MDPPPPYYGMYGNNMLSPRYIVTSPDSYLSHTSFSPQSAQNTQSFSSPASSVSPNYYQIDPPSPGQMLIVRTTTVTRNTTSIQPVYSTF